MKEIQIFRYFIFMCGICRIVKGIDVMCVKLSKRVKIDVENLNRDYILLISDEERELDLLHLNIKTYFDEILQDTLIITTDCPKSCFHRIINCLELPKDKPIRCLYIDEVTEYHVLQELAKRQNITVYSFQTGECEQSALDNQYYGNLSTTYNELVFNVEYLDASEIATKHQNLLNHQYKINGRTQRSPKEPLITLKDSPGQTFVMSDVSLKYGFSVNEPKTIIETSFTPIFGQNNYLAILPLNVSLLYNLEYIVFESKSKQDKYALHKKTTIEGDLYITEPIQLPKGGFKVILQGTDRQNHAIKKLLWPNIAPHKAEPDQIRKINIQEGQPIYLICTVDSLSNTAISWFKIGQSNAVKSSTTKKSNTLNHTIEESDKNDNGIYMCVAENSAGRSESKLIVDVRRTSLNVNTPKKLYTLQDGTGVLVLKCVVTPKVGAISIKWLFNGSPELPHGSIPNLPNLVLNKIDQKFNGTYTCVAQRKNEVDQDNIELIVEYPAKILNIFNMTPYTSIDTTKPIELFDHSELKIICGSEGNPKPNVNWINQNGVIISNTSTLTIKGSDVNDSAAYLCQVENLAGKDTKLIKVTKVITIIKPKLLPEFDTNYRVKLSDSFLLQCPVEMIPSNKIDFVWYHNTSRIDLTSIKNDSVKIKRIDHIHNGIYKCQASNEKGSVEAEFHLNVLYGANIVDIAKFDNTGSYIVDPSITQLDIFNVTALSLTCIVNGNPSPTTVWKKNGVIFAHSNKLQIYPGNNDFTAIYECSTQNELNSDKRTIELVEIIKPKLKQYRGNQHLIKDNEFHMTCPIEPGDYNITWYINNNNFDHHKQSDGSLLIKTVLPSMTGRAYCVASNRAGTAVATFNFDVLQSPHGLNILTPTYTKSTQQITPNMKQITLVKTDPLEIICSSQGNPTPQIYWLKNGQNFSNNESITIRSVERKDAATYTCVAENILGHQTELIVVVVHVRPYLLNTTGLENSTNINNVNRLRHISLSKIKLPKTYFKTDYEKIIKVNEYENVVLDCNMKGDPSPTINWFKNSENLNKQMAILELMNVNIENSGIYKCVGENDYGKITVIFYLYVHSIKPKLKLFDANYRVLLGDLFSLECPIETVQNTKTKIEWYHNSSRIASSSISNNRIQIDKLDHIHNGIYKCRASNKGGSVEAEFNVHVLYGAKILNIVKLDNTGSNILDPSITQLDIFNVTALSLTCIVNGNPSPTTVWKKNGVIFAHSNKLQIYPGNNDFSATYECFTQNELKSDKRAITLLEIIKPKLKPYIIAQNLIKDNEFRMPCPIEPGDYDITWYFNNNNFDHHKQSDGSLLIKKVLPSMTGRAYCVASNRAGTAVATFNFDVLQPPHGLSLTTQSYKNPIQHITNNKKQITLVQNEPLDITCNGQGNPTPQIYWLKNDRIFSRNKTITNHSIEPKDAATYTCVAENMLGNETEIIVVVVHVPPYLLTTTGLEYSTNINNANKLGNTSLNKVKVPNTYFKADYEKIIKVDEGEKVVLDCNMKGYPTPTINWFKNNEKLNKQLFVLEFTTAEVENSGIYKCVGENEHGKMGVIFYLNVQSIKPKLIKGFETNHRVPLDTRFSLDCPVDDAINNKIDIQWYHNTSRITSSSISNNRIQIDKLDHIHNGIYKCRASNKGGSVEAEFNVHVLYGAKILNIVKLDNTGSNILDPSITQLDIFNVTALSLTCIVNGNPSPTTVWKKNGVIFAHSNKLQIYPGNNDFSATYECFTQNELKSDKRAITLLEIIKPKLKPYIIAQNLIKDNEFRMPCPIEPGDYDITWYFNNNNFDHHKQSDGSLLIKKVLPSMTGRAYCVASNRAGTAVATFNFDVLQPPHGLSLTTQSYKNPIQHITNNKKQITLVQNEPLDITCNGQGNPTPQIYWLKNDRIFSRNKTITNHSIEPKDAATYTCVAENKLGNETEIIVVVVHVPPYLLTTTGLEYSTNINNANKLGNTSLNKVKVPNTYFKADYEKIIKVDEGEKVVLDCNMRGYPTPTINWFKNNEKLNKQLFVLEFTTAEVENSGIYKCVGENEHGKMGVIFYLNVQSIKPKLIKGFETNHRVPLGTRFSLDCPVDDAINNKIDIQWYHNTSRITSSSISNNRIQIDKLDHIHNGIYKCRASNKGGSVEAEFNVHVLYGAKILNIVKLDNTGSNILDPSITQLDIFNVTALSLTCIVNGNPSPTTVWKKNGVIFAHSNKLQIYPGNNDFSATYECFTQNELKSDKRAITLLEIIKPKLKPYIIAQNLIKDNEFRMPCPIEPGDYDITWYFNNNNFDHHKQSDGSLLIKKVLPSMTGRTYCVASNRAGTAVATFNFDVLQPPHGLSLTTQSYKNPIQHITNNKKQITLVQNEPLDITCNGQGNPTPQIYWLKNDRIFSRNKTITNHSIEPKDAATYTCVAENMLGNETEIIVVVVHVPPYLLTTTGLEYSTNINNANKLGNTSLNKVKVPNTYFKADYEKIIKVDEGEKVVLDCNMKGYPTPTINWFKNNEKLNKQLFVLEFTTAEVENSGIYKCVGENEHGKMGVIFYLNVQSIKPKLIKGFETNHRVPLGTRFSLDCPVDDAINNKIDIQWYHNTSRITSSSISNNRIQIDKLDHIHNGIYKCRASNKGGSVEAEFNVHVLYGAKILNIVKLDNTGSNILDPSITQLDIFNVTALSLTCIVNGNPSPTTVWKKNGVIFAHSNKLQIYPGNNDFSATYECFTQNELKSDKRAITLLEIIKPKLKPYIIAQTLIKDNEFRMPCPIEPGDYDITWYFNNNNFDHHKQSDGSLLIKKVLPSMTGRAYCVASNRAGTAVATFNFDVLQPPHGLSLTTQSYKNPIQHITNNKKQITLVQNEPLDITCNGQGNPTPQIYWLKNDRIFSRNKTITNHSIEPKDAATYTCVAENKLGNETEIIVVVVHVPPYLLTTTGLEYSTNINNANKLGNTSLNKVKVPNTYFKADYEKIIKVDEGEKVVLDCNMKGYPTPTINWFKNNEKLNKQLFVLEFTTAEVENSGIYKCVGENEHGKMGVIFYLNVQSIKPKLIKGFETNHRVPLGTRFSLDCPVDDAINNKIDIQWYHNTSRITSSSISNNRIQIDKLDHIHNGIYKCRASNKGGSVEAEFNVHVLYGAKILNIVKLDNTGSNILDPSITQLDIFNVTALSLTCIVNGNPSPTTVWKKNGVIFAHSNKLQIYPGNNDFSATYECFTQNELKSDKRAITLLEIIKPKLKPYIIAQTLIKDNEFRMPCPIEPGDYDITWYFNNNNFDHHKQSDGSLLIKKVLPSMTGRAYCVASNRAGTAVATFNFDVLQPPHGLSLTTQSYKNPIQHITNNKKQITLVQNEPLDITCNGQGNPTPQIYWLKNDRIFSRNKTITNHSIEPKDAATYTCVAENKLGNETEIIVVVVHVPPYLLTTTGLEYSTNINNANKLGNTSLNKVKVPNTYFKADYEKIIKVDEGEKVLLDCNMKGYPTPTINWFKNNEKLNKQLFVLEFTTAEVENSGIYKCVGENEHGKMGVIFYLNVQSIKPKLIKGFETNHRVPLGTRFSLDCPVDDAINNKIDIQWYHNTSRITSSSISNNRIQIDKLDHIHNGIYKCRASNKGGSVEAEFNVHVLYGAKILNIVKLDNTGSNILDPSITQLDIFNVTALSLTCIVNGNPSPTTVWKKNGVIFAHSNKLQIYPGNNDFSATYECFTQNELKSDKRAITLLEIIKPKLKPYIIAQTLIKDNEFRMPCPIEPGDYDITWYFNNNNFDHHKQSDGSLLIKKVLPSMTGRAYCVASNRAGTAVATFNFDVLQPPHGLSLTTQSYKNPIQHITNNKKQITLVQNEPLDITCNGQGNPTPQIYWLKNDRIFSRNKTITNHSIEPKDAATYTCVAENKLGNETEIIVVVVHVPPYLLTTTGLEYSTNINNANKLGNTSLNKVKVPNTYFKADYEKIIKVDEGEKVLLDCNMKGYPTPTINWFKNNEKLNKQLFVLEFTTAEVENSGIYKCVGENEHGKMGVIFYLNVQSIKPKLIKGFETNHRVPLGTRFSLDCPVDDAINNKIDIQWYHNTSRITSSSISNNRIQIDKLDHIHNGIYKCRASNKGGSVEAEFNVHVLYGAKILNIVKLDNTGSNILDPSITQLDIFNVTALSLTCIVNGNPSPTTVWKKNGVIFAHSNKLQIYPGNNDFSATYECFTQNELKSDKRAITLLEIIKPKLKPYIIAQNLIKDNEFRMPCPIEPGDYDITWYFNNNNFDHHKQSDGSLLIKKVLPSMTGRAYCVASNRAGTAVATFNFDVLQPPHGLSLTTQSYKNPIQHITNNKKQITLVQNEPLDITCNGQGNPTPQIYWLKNDRIFSRNKTITNHSIEPKDAATYTCVAENKLGNETEIIVVVVHVPPYLLTTTGLEYSTNINNANKLGNTSLNKVKVPNTYFKADYEKIIKVDEGEKVLLDCNMKGYPTPTINWFKNNEKLNKQLFVLEFTTAEVENSGIYKCVGENEHGKMGVIFYLNVQSIKPKLIKGFETNHRVPLGTRFSLDCPVDDAINNKIDIQWYHNTSRITSSSISNNRIQIDKLDHIHNGIYKCRASNKGGSVEAEFNVHVLYGAKILNIVKLDNTGSNILDPSITQLDIFNVTALSLTCIVNGNPSPTTVWKKNGVIFAHSNKLQIYPGNNDFSATYECFTQNELKSDKRAITLLEIIKPKLKPYIIAQNLIKDNEFRMPCPIEPGDYDITWYFNNNNFDHHKQSDGSLLIKKVFPSMTGRAYCVASNRAGTAVATFNFDVLQPPHGLSLTTQSYKNPIQHITNNKKQITLVQNEPLDITCNGQGNPTPQIYWLKNDRIFSRNKTITNHSIEPKDAATYTCVAENKLGNETEIIVVVVHVPPYLLTTTGLENSTNINNVNKLGITNLNRVNVPNMYFIANYEKFINVHENEKVLLDCNINGNPKPLIEWFKNNINLKKQTIVLEFTTAKIGNSGIYKCIGVNNYGKASIVFYVNVLSSPMIVSASSSKSVYELGEEIKFQCKSKGNHLPLIGWLGINNIIDNEAIFNLDDNNLKHQLFQLEKPIYLNGKTIVKLNDINRLERYGKLTYKFLKDEYIGELEYVIKSAKFSDTGQYKCISRIYNIKNTQIDKTVTIQVVKMPYLENAETIYNILQNIDLHRIKCPIKSLPSPTIQWYRGPSLIKPNQNFEIQDNFLKFRRPMPHHAGDYSCRGTNNGGTVEFKFKVFIFTHIADISNIVLNRSRKTKIQVNKNQIIQLKCPIKSAPIYWSKIVDSYPNKQRELLEPNPTYKFCANISQTIMCAKDAEPQYGEIFEIIVIEKPIIQPIEGKVEVKLDDILRLQCDATGEPKPTIQWYKYVEDQPYEIDNYPEFEVNSETLIKRRAETSDTTKYVCIARNNLGIDLQVFDVIVLNESHYLTPWSLWSSCTKTCGEGIQYKTRNCIHASCSWIQYREQRKCINIECPINGGWSDFSPFSSCSKSCVSLQNLADVATKEAKRECNNPSPAFGGRNCIGESIRIINCTVPICESIVKYKQLEYYGCPVDFVYDYKARGCLKADKCQRKGSFSVCRKDFQMCQTIGTDDYVCLCRPGYKQMTASKKNPECLDINECNTKPYRCGTKKCINTNGSYKCV